MYNFEIEYHFVENEHLSVPLINVVPPVPSSRTSISVRFLNPENPSSEREIADIVVDNILVREANLIITTGHIFYNVSSELHEIDQSINSVVKKSLQISIQRLLKENYSKTRID